jgi:fatty-acyl-CoA synthase
MSAETLASRLAAAALTPGRIVFLDAQEREVVIPHAELFARARRAAGGIAALGIAAGERVAIVAATSPAFFDGFFGAILAGAVPVPLYPPVRLGRLQEYHERTAAMLRSARARIVLADSRTRRVLGRSVEVARPELGCVALEDVQREPLPLRTHDPDAIAFIQFSSGTTREPKPVALTHRQILANADAIATAIRTAHPEIDGFVHVAASWLPLYHDMGLVGGVFTSLFHGRDLVLIPPELFVVRPATWLRAIAHYRATISPAPNFAYALCTERVKDEDLAGLDLSSWRVALNGAEPVTPLALERFVERFARWGLRPEALTPVYGLAEATLAVTFSALDRPFRAHRFDPRALMEAGRAVPDASGQAIVSLGPPLPGFDVAIVDDDGEALGAGSVGRVRVRGPSIMAGYDGMPEATREALVDGWLDTGDIGFLFDGELHLVGRAKDLIIVRGRNHAPQDVEFAIDDLPGIRTGCSAAVGALGQDGGGEALWIFVERARNAAIDDVAIAQQVRARVLERVGLAVERILVLDAGTLPRTSSGKIRRSETLRLHQTGRLAAPQRVHLPRLALEMLRSKRAFRRARSRH